MSNSPPDSDEEIEDCPICVEPFDGDDRLFLPCQCYYKVCMFCVKRIMEQFDGRCPGCRSVYNEANFRIREEEPEEIERRKQREQRRNAERVERARQQMKPPSFSREVSSSSQQQQQSKLRKKTSSNVMSPTMTSSSSQGGHVQPLSLQDNSQESALAQQRKGLANVRVTQPNIVFVLGLAQSIAKEDVLRRPEHFGQYGPITKVVVGHPQSSTGRPLSASAHITFARADDAASAIQGINGAVVDGHQIRAAFGTTRYCHYFLRGQNCTNPECLFLHEEVTEKGQQDAKNPSPSQTAIRANFGQSILGGTDPFALSSGSLSSSKPTAPTTTSNLTTGALEPLNGIELVMYDRQKTRPPVQTLPRAPGEGVNRLIPATPNSPVSYDCALSLVADLVIGRATMSEDLRKKLSFIAGTRSSSSVFSGLECVLASSSPIFIAPVCENIFDQNENNQGDGKDKKFGTRKINRKPGGRSEEVF